MLRLCQSRNTDNKLTVVTLSSTDRARKLPSSVEYLNVVSKINSLEELHTRRLESFMQVETTHAMKIDDTDEFISELVLEDIGVVTGNEYIRDGVGEVVIAAPIIWNATNHLMSPRYIHNGIMWMPAVKKIIPLLPKGLFYTESLLYYFLAKQFGYLANSSVKFEWNTKTRGFSKHSQISTAMINSMKWIAENESDVLGKLY